MAYTTIAKPNQYFNTVLYQSNNSTPQSITGVNFQPDFLWVKDRDGGGTHVLVDAVRGSTKWLASDQTSGEVTRADQVTSFDSDGFSLGADSGNFINYLTDNNVSWNWLANGAGVSNTDGDITSTVSASTTSGFSVVKYTGTGANATVGHGLGAEAKWVLVKRLDTTGGWISGHSSLGFTKNLYFTTAGVNTSSAIWNNTAPTSSVFSLGTDTDVNASGGTYVAYCFAEKKGFSKFGSYTGNGNADGAFVYTGFKPAFILIRSVSTTNWNMFDNKRSAFNVSDETLWSNSGDTEATIGTSYGMDILSNGFKARSTSSQVNFNNIQMVYMAFAENPIVTTDGLPATAR